MKKILVVEDDPNLSQLLIRKLSSESLEIISADNGQEAVKIAQAQHLDLILTDILMPQMDGIEAVYYIRQQSVNKEVPIIILTNLQETAYPEGVTKILIKSKTSLDEIVVLVRETLMLA